MNRRILAGMAALALGLAALPGVRAQDRQPDPPPPPARTGVIAPVATRHTLPLADRALDYRAVVETLPVVNERGETAAQVAVIAYVAQAGPSTGRPVTFVFNGGPGASSAFLHLGAMGPRVLVTGADGGVPTPPARVQDNPDSWLAFTDLVFVDPVGSGFSTTTRPDEEAAKPFWSISGDTRSLSEVIRLWLVRNDRWNSPKFIAGESYGGFRAAQLARALLHDAGIGFNGLVMISPALEFTTISPDANAVLPWALVLPSLVASARAQGRGDPAMTMDEVERFALTDYLVGIAAIAPHGPGPDPVLIRRLTGLLGLEEQVVGRHHGRVPARVFAERLLQDRGRALSLYDGGLSGPNSRPGQGGPDPLLEAIRAPLSTAYNTYVRGELKLETELPFRVLDDRPSRHWNWEGARGGPGPEDGAMDELAEAMALTPGLGVLVIHGRTDLVTPYMASRWLLDRLDLPEDIRAHARLEVLDGGHMMYFRPDQRAALTRLAADFYHRQAPES
ncbi:MAG TPA: septum formation initiator [Azospirillaceae bacterium]|nr:septum formation initiator [Azospirillaceae bacterium]